MLKYFSLTTSELTVLYRPGTVIRCPLTIVTIVVLVVSSCHSVVMVTRRVVVMVTVFLLLLLLHRVFQSAIIGCCGNCCRFIDGVFVLDCKQRKRNIT